MATKYRMTIADKIAAKIALVKKCEPNRTRMGERFGAVGFDYVDANKEKGYWEFTADQIVDRNETSFLTEVQTGGYMNHLTGFMEDVKTEVRRFRFDRMSDIRFYNR